MSQLTEKTEHATPNRLVTLKVLVFLFFGALQTMYAFLPYHMQELGFKLYDIRLITLISALVSIIGPLIVGFILDRVSLKRPSAYGKWLRVLLFIFFILAGLAFGSLLLVEKASEGKDSEHSSNVTFSCNDNGGHVFVRKNITADGVCANLEGVSGELTLINCTYTCETPEDYNYLFHPVNSHKVIPARLTSELASVQSNENAASDYDYDENLPEPAQLTAAEPTQSSVIPPPHICLRNATNYEHCHVYLDSSVIRLSEISGDKAAEDTNKFSDEWCMHPLASTSCRIPREQVTWMNLIRAAKNLSCATPAVECRIEEPFKSPSILSGIQRVAGSHGVELQYDLYVTLRVIAELFPVIIHTLLNVAIIIATRETSVGRGNVGHQWAFYPIGVLVFASVIGLLNHVLAGDVERFFVPILTFSITMFVCAIIVLFSGKLPLTPSDWWWHTKCGMLAIPMSALKRYKWVIAAIALVALVMGGLWHVLEAYRHLFTLDLIEYGIFGDDSSWQSKSFVYVIGALLAAPLIWNGEKLVDCIGHSNVFILAFLAFAIRFAGLYFDVRTSFTTLYEILEPMDFYLPWLALILFARHLVPKKFLALGQALLVVLCFALGRAIGFFYGTSIIADDRDNRYKYDTPESNIVAEENDLQAINTVASSIACAAATIYFVVYHCILLPRYRVPTNRLVAANSDANISPQHVFHDERSRKGYFRY